jgi:hypothetical protein
MRHRVTSTGLALAAICLAGLSQPSAAQQQPSREMAPLRGAATGTSSTFVIPTDPPVAVAQGVFKGEDNGLGAFTTMLYGVWRLGADGTPLAITDGIFAATGANGDAYFGTWSALARPSEKPGIVNLEGITLITGGKGRFQGAAGQLVTRAEIDLASPNSSYTFEGTITPPKAP